MKLAYVSSQKQGETDRLLTELADDLQAGGLELRGIVKEQNYSAVYENGCDMYVRVLPDGPSIKITQDLGEGSNACRLDPASIVEAVARVENSSFDDIDLFILNKFGPEEIAGRGFCTVLAKAVEHDIPVLVGAGVAGREAFQKFAGGVAESLPDDATALRNWCRKPS